MKPRSLFILAGSVLLATVTPSAFAGGFAIGITVPLAPVVAVAPAVPVYAPPVVIAAPVPVYAPSVVVAAPAPVVVAAPAIAVVAPAPVVAVRAGYWGAPRGVVVVR
jgi:hypothetical protein